MGTSQTGTVDTEVYDGTAVAMVAAPSLVINEVAAKGDPRDWFELYNTGDLIR